MFLKTTRHVRDEVLVTRESIQRKEEDPRKGHQKKFLQLPCINKDVQVI